MFKNEKLSALFTILFITSSCSININTNTINNNNNLSKKINHYKPQKSSNIDNLTKTYLKSFINMSNNKQIIKILQKQFFENKCKKPKIILINDNQNSNNFLINTKNSPKSPKSLNTKNPQILLQAECDNKISSIPLNSCLSNQNGVLIAKKNGQFQKSCSKCKLNFPYWDEKIQPINLECTCYDGELYDSLTNINLNDFIYYDENSKNLKCTELNLNLTLNKEKKALDRECILGKFSEDNKFFSVCENKNVIDFDLDKCISNNNGTFDFGGNFLDTCDSCFLQREGFSGSYFLSCDCLDEKKSIRREYRFLSEFLEYREKAVRCRATETLDNGIKKFFSFNSKLFMKKNLK